MTRGFMTRGHLIILQPRGPVVVTGHVRFSLIRFLITRKLAAINRATIQSPEDSATIPIVQPFPGDTTSIFRIEVCLGLWPGINLASFEPLGFDYWCRFYSITWTFWL